MFPRLRAATPWIFVAAVACGVPSSFDNITGGERSDGGSGLARDDGGTSGETVDPTLRAPRQLAPLSGSWVNSLHPKFRWALQDIGGARLELCRTRSCEGAKKTFDVSGPEYTVVEDLEPGVWFWRVSARTAAATISKESDSRVWEVLVRPPAGRDLASPNGAILDFNGDGRADLVASVVWEFPGGSTIEVTPFLATSDDGTSFQTKTTETSPGWALLGPEPRYAIVDTNGDGFSDIVFPDVSDIRRDAGAGTQHDLYALLGSAAGTVALDISPIATAAIPEHPEVHEAGDLDGDGFGDVVFTTRGSAYIVYGTAEGLGLSTPWFDEGLVPLDAGVFDGEAPPPTQPYAVTGAFAFNDDLFSDVAIGNPGGETPVAFLLGGDQRAFVFNVLQPADPSVASTRATALTTGDFDGDGLMDLAFTTTSKGKPAICIASASDPAGVSTPRCLPLPATATAPISLIACDLDGDGHDKLLMSSGPGVDIVRREGDVLVMEHLSTPFGLRLAVISPGRPGPALWAAGLADGSAIGIFRGKTQASRLLPPPGALRFGPALR